MQRKSCLHRPDLCDFFFWPHCSGVKAWKLQLCLIAWGSCFALWGTSFSMHLQSNKVLSMLACLSFLSQETQACVHPPILMLDSFTSGLILTQSWVIYRLYTSLWNRFLCSSTIGELFQFSCFVLPRRIQIRSLRILQVCNAFSLTAIHCTNVCEAIPLLSACFAGIFPHSPPGHSHPPSHPHPQSVDSWAYLGQIPGCLYALFTPFESLITRLGDRWVISIFVFILTLKLSWGYNSAYCGCYRHVIYFSLQVVCK